MGFAGLPVLGSDIDFAADLKGQAFLLSELKTGDQPLPYGQRVMLNRVVQGLGETVPTVCLIARHWTSVDEVVPLPDCVVSEAIYRWPTQSKVGTFKYGEHRPTVQEFTSDYCRVLDLPPQKLKQLSEPWDVLRPDEEYPEDQSTPEKQGLFMKLYLDEVIPTLPGR